MQAKIISLQDYKDKKIPTREEIKNNEAKINESLEKIDAAAKWVIYYINSDK